jgi:[NiFe] hydrogenase diaphorase moiety large subunit
MGTGRESILFREAEPDEGLRKAVGMTRLEIISQVRESGLRGRGGAGFPTGSKWNFAALAQDPLKYVVCNADEGEPGTFKDRVLLSERADLVLEGMTIAARAIGAREGFIYLRGEYEYLRGHLEAVIRRRGEAGLLGDDILGTGGFTFRVAVRMGAGAYVCGEETALIESLEGHRGEPRNRPPFPVNTGFLGHPTAVNNVETFALAARVIALGAEAFARIGPASSTGTKLFSVSGDCARSGVYELPMGLSIAELLREVGGEEAKAVQVGGASGTCVPRAQFSRRLAFDDASTGGSIIVFGPGRDMLRVARNFMEFFDEESCGQCTPCRQGNHVLLEGIRKLEAGVCSMAYLQELRALGETMQLASKCGLGQSSPNAFLSIVEHFKDEILARPARVQAELS